MYSLILLNGGVGARIGAQQPKQLLKLRGIPILVYSLVTADKVKGITQIVLNYPEGWREAVEEVLDAYAISTPVTLVAAGDSRHESVAASLRSCENDDVLVHETARPLVAQDDFERLIASEYANVALMTPIAFTVAPVDPETTTVTGSLERSRLRNVQLPQKFARADLESSHRMAADKGLIYTEDSTLVVDHGHEVHFIEGSDVNLKVTTPTDVRMVTFLLRAEETDND